MSFDEQNSGMESWTRRRFVQLGAASAVSLGVMSLADAEQAPRGRSMMDVPFEKRDPRVAMIGLGGRGTSLLGNLLAADAQVVALCDIVKEKGRACRRAGGRGRTKEAGALYQRTARL